MKPGLSLIPVPLSEQHIIYYPSFRHFEGANLIWDNDSMNERGAN